VRYLLVSAPALRPVALRSGLVAEMVDAEELEHGIKDLRILRPNGSRSLQELHQSSLLGSHGTSRHRVGLDRDIDPEIHFAG
jgi:hypothetical protein